MSRQLWPLLTSAALLKPYQYVAIRSDIPELKPGEDRVREQAELLDQAPDTILVCDLDHNILFWNKGAEEMYGWPATEAIGKNASKLLLKGTFRAVRRESSGRVSALMEKATSRWPFSSAKQIGYLNSK
jgi:PAS domain-containing protein